MGYTMRPTVNGLCIRPNRIQTPEENHSYSQSFNKGLHPLHPQKLNILRTWHSQHVMFSFGVGESWEGSEYESIA